MTAWVWADLFPDPREWVAADDDPAAHWALLTGVLDRPHDDPEVRDTRRAVLIDPATSDLLDRLDPWDAGRPLPGHDQRGLAS